MAYAALAGTDAALAETGRLTPLRWVTKPALMPLLIPGADPATARALALGGAGDVALLGSSDAAFTAGLSAFLAGHVAWLDALRRRGGRRVLRRRPLLAVPYLLCWAGLNAYLWPRTGKDRLPVLVYSGALVATAAAALDTGEPAAATGGALFLASDALLALDRFAGIRVPAHEAVVMTTYAAAQALLAAGGHASPADAVASGTGTSGSRSSATAA